MDTMVMDLNQWGSVFVNHAGLMLLQAGALIALLWLLDCILYRHLKASLRYGLWMLVLIKLILSPHLSLPTGIGSWIKIPSVMTSEPVQDTYKPSILETETPVTASAMAEKQPPKTAPNTTKAGTSDMMTQELTWQSGALLCWLTVTGILLLGLLLRSLHLELILHRAQPPDPTLLASLDQAQSQVTCPGLVEMRVTDEISSPVVCRVWRPVILIPQHLADTLPEDKQRAILIHELCHIKRLDPWVNLAQTLLQVFYLYHPLVWWANACIRRVREQAVDEMVLVYLKDQRQCYSHTLIDVAQAMVLRTQFGMGLIGVSETKTQLNERIKLMLYRPTSLTAGLNGWSLLLILALGGVLLPMSPSNRLQAADVPGFTTSTQLEQDTLLTQLENTEHAMITAFNQRQIEQLMQGYCDDVISLPPNETTQIGKPILKQARQLSMAKGITIQGFKKKNQQVWISGDLIYVVGPYAMSIQTPEVSGMVTEFRNGITLWQRQADGSLKIKTEAYNKETTPDDPMGYGDYATHIADLKQCTQGCDTLPDDHRLYQKIRDIEIEFHQLFVTNQRMKALDYYTEDTLLIPTGYQVVRGKTALRDMFTKTANDQEMVAIEQQIIEVQGNEHMIYAVNLFNWTVKNPNSGQNFTIPGKGIHVWQRQTDGSWKILYDMNSPDLSL